MKAVSPDNDREELTPYWALICGTFLLLASTFCSRISRDGAGLAGTPPHLPSGCQAHRQAASSAPPRLRWKVERIVRKTPRMAAAALSWWHREKMSPFVAWKEMQLTGFSPSRGALRKMDNVGPCLFYQSLMMSCCRCLA